jgi:hypothetical protein
MRTGALVRAAFRAIAIRSRIRPEMIASPSSSGSSSLGQRVRRSSRSMRACSRSRTVPSSIVMLLIVASDS